MAPGPVLGIETSCDETAAAVVVAGGAPGRGPVVRSSVVASQHELHAEYRGVVPEIASRAHAERMLPVVRRALAEAGVRLGDLGAIAVGHRPGLIGSLVVGVACAKALAWRLGVPLVGVDHVQAHLASGVLDRGLPALPALGMVVSGGHTALYRCATLTSAVRLGGTIDDAVGEAFDKAAAVLGLPFPGGPSLDRLARTPGARDDAIELPVARLGRGSLDLSFSGLKTALLYGVRGVPGRRIEPGEPTPVRPAVADLAASFERAAVEALILKVRRALDQGREAGVPYRTLLVGGGVSANTRLRAALATVAAERGLELRLPPMAYCVDNGAMIAGLALLMIEAGQPATDPLALAADPASAI